LSSRVLILGAGLYQAPLIRKARNKGYHVTVATRKGDYPGLAFADETWLVDTRDHEELLRLSLANNIEAVLTTGTDVAIPSLGYLCDQLGLPGITYETAQLCSNKILAQQRFAERGIPAAKHLRITTLDEARKAMSSIGLPVIIKAPDSSGSRGVVAITRDDELNSAFEQAMAVSRL
jgi:biotin carboxylase